jgi:hypothetical protein
MGRVKNIILDKQHEFEDDLVSLRKQLSDKESEFLNFELQQHLQLIWENINEMKRRLDTLEKHNNVKTQRTLFYVLGAMMGYWYYYRN